MIRIGLDIGGTGIKLGLVNEQGQILRKSSIETRTDISFQEQVLAMVNATKALLDAQGVSLDDIHSIGAGVPGIADPRTGEVIFCTNLGWNHVPFRSTFQQYINKPVYIDNDATVAGLAESVAGISKGTSSSVFLTLGTGVGAGIIINGRIWSGAHGVGSEVGHAILELRHIVVLQRHHYLFLRIHHSVLTVQGYDIVAVTKKFDTGIFRMENPLRYLSRQHRRHHQQYN